MTPVLHRELPTNIFIFIASNFMDIINIYYIRIYSWQIAASSYIIVTDSHIAMVILNSQSAFQWQNLWSYQYTSKIFQGLKGHKCTRYKVCPSSSLYQDQEFISSVLSGVNYFIQYISCPLIIFGDKNSPVLKCQKPPYYNYKLSPLFTWGDNSLIGKCQTPKTTLFCCL